MLASSGQRGVHGAHSTAGRTNALAFEHSLDGPLDTTTLEHTCKRLEHGVGQGLSLIHISEPTRLALI
eukprot:423542-Alexandrium_andersonii.AAC.1